MRFPISPIQLPYWFHFRQHSTSALYNRATALRLRGEIDESAFERTWLRLVQRHEMERMHIVDGDEPLIEVENPNVVDFAPYECIDARRWDEAALTEAVQRKALEPLDLCRGPVARAALFRTAADECVFMFVHSHIFGDFSSGESLLLEASSILAEEMGGAPANLPPVSDGEYARFVERHVEILNGETGRRLDEYWLKTLEGAPARLEMHRDHHAVSSDAPTTSVSAALGTSLLDRVSTFAQAEGASKLRVLLAAWCALLDAHTGQGDVVVGMAVDCREKAQAGVVGNFANLVPIRARFDPDTSFRSLVAEIDGAVAGAIAHRHYPLATLVARVASQRSAAPAALFDSFFNFGRLRRRPELTATILIPEMRRPVRAPFGPLEIYGAVPIELPGGGMALELLVAESDGELFAVLKYDASRFQRTSAERLLARYSMLLDKALAEPGAPVGSHRLLTEDDERSWRGLNDTATPIRDGIPVHRLFEERVAAEPGATAIEFAGARLTYRDVDDSARRIASALVAHGVGRGDRVIVFMERSATVPIALLACWMVGAVFVVLDPTYPRERIEVVTQLASPRVVLLESKLRDRIDVDAAFVAVDELLDSESGDPVELEGARGDDLAYLLFTSGSTGEPKGVSIAHAGLVNYVSDVARRWKIEPGDRVLAFASFGFDSSISEWVTALTHGATLVVRPSTCIGGSELARFIAESRVTHVMLPPAVWATIPDDEQLPLARTVVTAGDAVSQRIVDRWASGRTMINEYGPTEVTVCATSSECTPGMPPTIGRPISNVEVWVESRPGVLAPTGAAGELCVSSVGVAKGYFERPELTAERFVHCSHSDRFEVLYRTGDRACLDVDGTLDFLGRVDGQVKLRGFRVELGDVENAVRAHADVDQVVAAVVRRDGVEPLLVAYVKYRDGCEVDAAELRRAVAQKLPDYMVPSRFEAIAEVPLNAHGKVDRSKLPPLTATSAAFSEDVSSPVDRSRRDAAGGSLLDVIVSVWCAVLGLDRVGEEDDFFEIGGTSLSAVEAAAELSDRLSAEVPVLAMFQFPRAAALAAVLGRSTAQALPLIELAPRKDQDAVLYVLPSAGGEVVASVGVGRDLGALTGARTVGVNDPELVDGVRSTDDTFESMSKRCAALIADDARGAPIRLVGWSFGGMLALFVARELTTRGCTVQWVVLLDTHVRGDGTSAELHSFAAVAPSLGLLAPRFGVLGPEQLESVARELLRLPEGARYDRACEIARSLGVLASTEKVPAAPDGGGLLAMHQRMLTGTKPPRIDCPLVYVRARSSAIDPAGTWEAVSPSLVNATVDGNHFSIVGPERASLTALAIADAVQRVAPQA